MIDGAIPSKSSASKKADPFVWSNSKYVRTLLTLCGVTYGVVFELGISRGTGSPFTLWLLIEVDRAMSSRAIRFPEDLKNGTVLTTCAIVV